MCMCSLSCYVLLDNVCISIYKAIILAIISSNLSVLTYPVLPDKLVK